MSFQTVSQSDISGDLANALMFLGDAPRRVLLYTITMTRRTRLLLAIAGMILILVSLCALAYVFAPLEPVIDQATVPPTLFVPPQSAAPALRMV